MSISIDDICGLAVAIGQYIRIKFVSMSAGYHKVNECIEIRISSNAIVDNLLINAFRNDCWLLLLLL